MSELDRLAGLLTRTAEAHHRAFLATDGFDPSWASWYAGYLLANGFGRYAKVGTVSADDLASFLIEADRRHQNEVSPAPWERYYAKLLLAAFDPDGTLA